MKCPTCNAELRMANRQGIEIDYCPQCHGVWLGHGELEKLIEQSAAETTARGRCSEPRPDEYYLKMRKKSFVGELFDFDLGR